jgi:hypothetical protein
MFRPRRINGIRIGKFPDSISVLMVFGGHERALSARDVRSCVPRDDSPS